MINISSFTSIRKVNIATFTSLFPLGVNAMGLNLKYRIWVDESSEVFLGEGRIRLLEAIRTLGSISKASKSMNMSSKKAWKLLNSMNARGVTPLVQTSTGGISGGGAVLTQTGLDAIKLYRSLQEKFDVLAKAENEKILNGVVE